MKKDISGVIRLGKLKRIQIVLNRNWKLKNRFENRNWEKEIEFIQKGRGCLIPVNISVDFFDENLIFLLNNEVSNSNIIKAKRRIESILKSLVLQK